LADRFWNGLKEIAAGQKTTVLGLILKIDDATQGQQPIIGDSPVCSGLLSAGRWSLINA
jgi:hypothetical protein